MSMQTTMSNFLSSDVPNGLTQVFANQAGDSYGNELQSALSPGAFRPAHLPNLINVLTPLEPSEPLADQSSSISIDHFSRSLRFTGSTINGAQRSSNTHDRLTGSPSRRADPAYYFGRLFPDLEPFEASDETLLTIGRPSPDSQNPAYAEDSQVRGTDNNSENPVGLTYIGQLLTHDTSLDLASQLGESSDPDLTPNSATPWLDLDTIYRFNGRSATRDPNDSAKLSLGNNLGNERDFSRDDQGRALLADRRNDENNNIAQVAAIFMEFHNQAVDALRDLDVPESQLFGLARQFTEWHWQSVIVNEFLPTFVDQAILDDIAINGRQLYTDEQARAGVIPVEFSVAANRFGHSITRGRYTLNDEFDRVRLFPLSEFELNRNLIGGVPIAPERQIEWERFFDFREFGVVEPDGDQFSGLQVARKIDRLLARPLLRLPIGGPGFPDFILDTDNTVAGRPVVSLESITLLRGKTFGVPSGQDVAEALGLEPLTNDQFELNNPDEIILPEPLTEAPLSLYILEEARIQQNGEKLGEVGGRILAEVILGLLEYDRNSILNVPFTSPITGEEAVTTADLIASIGWIDLPEGAAAPTLESAIENAVDSLPSQLRRQFEKGSRGQGQRFTRLALNLISGQLNTRQRSRFEGYKSTSRSIERDRNASGFHLGLTFYQSNTNDSLTTPFSILTN